MKRLTNLLIILFFSASLWAEESIEVSHRMLFTEPAAVINTNVAFVEITIEATDLTTPLSLWLGGANRALFTLSAETVPAGTGTHTITLSYLPTTAGVHKCQVNIESNTNYELNTSFAVNAVAYDPANPPAINVYAESLKEFVAAADAKHEQKFSITTANLLDWNGKIIFESQSEGSPFRLNSSSLLKDGTQEYTLTFEPLQEGNYTATLAAFALLTDTIRFTITGRCTQGSGPEAKEGDELPLVTDHPLNRYTTSFDGVARNQPLALEGWKNLAMTGNRAWWGFEFEGDACAKVTPYDSRATSDSKCEMLLISPALDFRNAATKLVTFRLRGDFLSDEQVEQFEVCYIDVEDGDLYISPIEMYVPCTADESGNWFDYVLDLDGQDVADVFFIGFRLTSQRGRNHTGTYYMDDFTWGRTDVKQIKSPVKEVILQVKPGQTLTIPSIEINGYNLEDGISVSLYGADKDFYTLPTEKLPAIGGKIDGMTFLSPAEGNYGVYLTLQATGAPVLEIPIYVIVSEDAPEPEGIPNTPLQTATQKLLRNGQIVIKRGQNEFTILGIKKINAIWY